MYFKHNGISSTKNVFHYFDKKHSALIYDISVQTKLCHTLSAVYWFRMTPYFVLVGGYRPFA
jgi:hypothetical protein